MNAVSLGLRQRLTPLAKLQAYKRRRAKIFAFNIISSDIIYVLIVTAVVQWIPSAISAS